MNPAPSISTISSVTSAVTDPPANDPNVTWMGKGYNIFGGSVVSVDNLLGQVINTPAVQVNPVSHYEGHAYTCETATELQEEFDLAVGLETSYGGFSGALKAKYGVSSSQSGQYGYGWTHQRADINLITFTSSPSYQMLCEDAQNLPKTYEASNEAIFYRFFMRYGTHYVKQLYTGGRIDMYTKWNKEQQYSQQTVSASMEAQYSAVLYSAKGTAESNWSKVNKSWFQDSSTDITADGGDVSHLLHGPLQYGAYLAQDDINAWRSSLSAKPVVTKLQLAPLSEIFNDGRHHDQYNAVSAAMDDFLGSVITLTSMRDANSADMFIGPTGGQTKDFPGQPGDPGIFILSRKDLSILSSYYYDASKASWRDATGRSVGLQALIAQFDNTSTLLVYASTQIHAYTYPNDVRNLIVSAQPDGFLGGYQALAEDIRKNTGNDNCFLHTSLYSFLTWGTPANTRDGEDTFLYTGNQTTETREKLTLVLPLRFDEGRQMWYVPQI